MGVDMIELDKLERGVQKIFFKKRNKNGRNQEFFYGTEILRLILF